MALDREMRGGGERERERQKRAREIPGRLPGTQREPPQIYVLFITSDTPMWRVRARSRARSRSRSRVRPCKLTLRFQPPSSLLPPRPRPPPPRAPICLPCSETGVCTTRTASLPHAGESTGGTTRRGTNVRVRGDTLMTSGHARGRRTVR